MRIKNKLLNIVGITLVFCLVFSYASGVLFPKWKNKDNNVPRTITFYNQPKDSIDVLIIGASTLRNGIAPLTMWEEYGFTSYVRATGSQPIMISYYYLVESLKFQQPKVVVINGESLLKEFNVDERESAVRKSIDPLRLSLLKTQLILEILSESEMQTFSSFIFPLLRYHSRWNEINQEDFEYYKIDKYDPFRGQYIAFQIESFEFPEDFMLPTEKVKQYNERSLYYYEKLIRLCKESGINVVFVSLPKLENSDYSEYLGIKQFAENHDVIYLNYALPELFDKIELDPNSDFDNINHVNFFGARKISKHLGAFLQENFNLSDKRNDPEYEQWDIDLQYLKSLVSEVE